MSLLSNIRAGRAYVEVTAETSKLQRNLTSAQAQLQNFGRTCTNVGKDLLMFSGTMTAPLVMAAKSFAGFDDSMRLVQAVTQATDADFKALTKTAQRLGRDTSYTAQQAADAMVSLGRMGFSPTEIQASIDAVLNLARSTGTELAEAGDIAANSMRIFGIEASQMSDVADVLTVTANSSAQTLIDLFEALKMGGPQAAAAGESIRETSAAIAVLANMGIKGSLAGTALRKSFSQFAKVKVQDQLRSVGVETVDANGNLRKMAEIMRDIAKAMSTMPTAEKLAFAEDIFDIRGSLAGLTLTANTDELDAMLVKLQDVEGVAADTAKKMDAGLGGAFRLLLSAVEGAMNAIADAMNSTLQPLIVKVTAVINTFTQWIEANRGLVTAFAVTVAGAAGLAVVLIAIGVAAKGAAAGITVVQTAIKGFTFLQGVAIAHLLYAVDAVVRGLPQYGDSGDGRYGKILCGFGACLDIREPGAGKHHSDEQCRSRRGSEVGTGSQMAGRNENPCLIPEYGAGGGRCDQSTGSGRSSGCRAVDAGGKMDSHDKCAEKIQFSRHRGNRRDQSTGGGRSGGSGENGAGLGLDGHGERPEGIDTVFHRGSGGTQGAGCCRRSHGGGTRTGNSMDGHGKCSEILYGRIDCDNCRSESANCRRSALHGGNCGIESGPQSRNCRYRAFHGGESESCGFGFRRCCGKLPAGGGIQGRGGGNGGSGSGHELYCRSSGGGCADCAGSGSGWCVHLSLPRRILYRAAFGQDEHASGKGRPAPQNG